MLLNDDIFSYKSTILRFPTLDSCQIPRIFVVESKDHGKRDGANILRSLESKSASKTHRVEEDEIYYYNYIFNSNA